MPPVMCVRICIGLWLEKTFLNVRHSPMQCHAYYNLEHASIIDTALVRTTLLRGLKPVFVNTTCMRPSIVDGSCIWRAMKHGVILKK